MTRRRTRISLAVVSALLASVVAVVGPVGMAEVAAQSANCGTTIGLRNGGFEQPSLGANTYRVLDTNTAEGQQAAWKNTAEPYIEVWSTPFNGVTAGEGSQFAELNANLPGTLYQDLATQPGAAMTYSLLHRGRLGIETMKVQAGPPGGPLVDLNTYADPTTAWARHSGNYTVPAGQTTTRFAFTAVGGGTTGNLLDDIEFALTAGSCDDTAATPAGTAVDVDVLSNDVGAGLTVVGTPTVTGGPSVGTASVVSNKVRFTPAAGFSGTATITYQNQDGAGNQGGSAAVTVAVRPVGVADTATTPASQAVTVDVLANDLGANKVVTSSTTPAHGTVSVPVGGANLVYTPAAGFTGTDTFSYTATATGGPTYSATVTVTVTASADLTLQSPGDVGLLPTSQVSGQTYTMAAEVVNLGPSSAANPSVTFTLPALTTYVANSAPAGTSCTPSGSTVVCTSASALAARTSPGTGSRVFGIEVRTTNPNSNNTAVTPSFTAAAASATSDPVPDNNSGTAALNVAANADLAITAATASPKPVVAGQSSQWTFQVENLGATPAGGVGADPGPRLAISPPSPSTAFGGSGWSNFGQSGGPSATVPAGWSCSVAVAPDPDAGKLVCIAPAALASGTTASITVAATVSPATTPGSIVLAAVASTGTNELNTSNNLWLLADSVTDVADLGVTVTTPYPSPTVAPGSSPSIGFTVHNYGPSTAVGTFVAVTMPTGIVATAVPAQCSIAAGPPQVVQCGLGSVAPNVDVVIGPVGTRVLASAAVGPLTSTATATSSTPEPGTDPHPNSAATSATVDVNADLQITTGISKDPPVPGQPVQLYVTVFNAGPSVAAAPVVQVDVPLSTAPVTAPAGCSPLAPDRWECVLPAMAPGDTTDLVFQGVLVASQAPGSTLTWTSSVLSTTPDPDTSNNSSVLTTSPVVQESDLVLSAGVYPAPMQAGQDADYFFRVTNNGPSDAASVQVEFDVDLTNVDFSGVVLPSGCAEGPAGHVVCTLGTIAAGASASGIFGVHVLDSATGDVCADAAATFPGDDPVLGNNTATVCDDTTVSADIGVVAAPATRQLVPGAVNSAVFTVTNNGPSATTVTPVQVTVPVGSTNITVNGVACNPTAQANVVVCNVGPLAKDATDPFAVNQRTLTVTFQSPLSVPGSPTVVAQVVDRLDPSQPVPDLVQPVAPLPLPVPCQPSGCPDSATVTYSVVAAADLAVTGRAPSPLVPGLGAAWSFTVTNNGPSTATGNRLTVTLPSGLRYFTSVGAVCTAAGQVLTCPLPNLAPGAATPVTVYAVTGGSVTGSVVVVGRVSGAATDTVAGNNVVALSATSAPQVDLVVGISVSPNPLRPGGTGTVTVLAVNKGPSTATGTTVSVPLPSGTSFRSSPGNVCRPWARNVVCQVGTLGAGQYSVATFTVSVARNARGTLQFTARIASDQPDLAPGTNSSTVAVRAGSSAKAPAPRRTTVKRLQRPSRGCVTHGRAFRC